MVPRQIAQSSRSSAKQSGGRRQIARGRVKRIIEVCYSPLHPTPPPPARRHRPGRRYGLDSVRLDYARYPNQRFDWPLRDRRVQAEMREARRKRARARRDADLDLLRIPTSPAEWKAFAASASPRSSRIRQVRRAAEPSSPRRCSRSSGSPDGRIRTGAAGCRASRDAVRYGLHAGAGAFADDRGGARHRQRPGDLGGIGAA